VEREEGIKKVTAPRERGHTLPGNLRIKTHLAAGIEGRWGEEGTCNQEVNGQGKKRSPL